MERDRRFWEKIAAKYASQPISDMASYETKLAKTREFMRPDMEVLEIGCGTGGTAIAHAPHVRHIRAVDVSEEMLRFARDKAAAEGAENVTFERAGIASLEVPDGSVDMVMAHSILHLLADPWAVLGRIHGWLKPGGVLVSSTACLSDMGLAVRLVIPVMQAIGKAPRLTFFSGDELLAGIEAAGLTVEHQWRPGPRKALFVIARKAG